MSYAGKESRVHRAVTAAGGGRSRSASTARVADRELPLASRQLRHTIHAPAPHDLETDWQQVAVFAAGALLGVAVGAGAALLLAPQSGAQSRHDLARRGRRLKARTADAWDDLRDELQYAARRSRRKLGRALRRRRRTHEMASDALED